MDDQKRLAGKVALVTGATAGIGWATALRLANRGAKVVAVGRRGERLTQLAKEHENIRPLCLDVTDRKAVETTFANDLANGIDILVNNAGLSRGVAPVAEAELADWDEMIDTNIRGLMQMTRIALPSLCERGGDIVNLGSVAGRWTYPGGAVYCATKHAVRAFSEGLRLDLQGSGIRVICIEPGLVETEFSEVRFSGDKERASAVYMDTEPLQAEDIADAIVWSLECPSRMNVQEMVVYPTKQASVRDVVRTG